MLRAKKDTVKYLFDSIIYIWPRKLAFIYEIKAGRLQQWDKKKSSVYITDCVNIFLVVYQLCKFQKETCVTISRKYDLNIIHVLPRGGIMWMYS